MSSVKKRDQSPVTENSPDTQVARSQQRARNTVEKPVNRTTTPALAGSSGTPAPSLTAKRPPTGRRRGRKQVVEVESVVEEAPPPDPFAGVIQQFDNEVGETTGAVMLVGKEESSADDFGAEFGDGGGDAVAINDVSHFNPHYIHALLVGAVTLFFIVVFALYIEDLSKPLKEVRDEVEAITLQVDEVIMVLTQEYQVAASLMSTTEYYLSRNQGNSQLYAELAAAAILAYQTAIRATNAAVTYTSLIFEKHETKVFRPLGCMTWDTALNMATLDAVRDAALKGSPSVAVFEGYDMALRNLVMFEGRLLSVRSMGDGGSDRSAVARLAALVEEQNYGISAAFSKWVNATSPTTNVRALNSYDELSVPWTLDAVSASNEALRLPLSMEEYPASPIDTTLRDHSAQMNGLVIPSVSQSVYRQLGEQSFVGQPVNWDPIYSATLLETFLPQSIAELDGNRNAQLRKILDREVPARRTAILTCLILLFILSVLALIAHIVNSIVYHRNREEHDAANREIRLLQRSLNRMTNFVMKASRLDIAAVSSTIRRSQRAKTLVPPEEQQLYAALSSLRDVELFMPSTVTHPPIEINKMALNKAQLFLSPALAFTKGTVALRINLSVFHSQFFTAGVKQKALQHQMTRCLTALQELTDEHVTHNGSILNVQGDHAIMWLNLLRPANYPNMCAISIALALSEECNRLSIRTPAMCIACGDALAGHISSVSPDSPAPQLASSAMCFTAFGSVTKDFNILETVARVHDTNITLNNTAALSFFQEKVEFDGEVFHGNVTASLSGFMPSANNNSDFGRDGEANQEGATGGEEAQGKSTNRGPGTLPPRERLTLEERLRRLHCYFRPLEMVNASTSRSSEETLAVVEHNFKSTRDRQAMLRQQRRVNPLGIETADGVAENATDLITLDDGATFRDYSRDLVDGSVIFPCFALVPFQVSKEEDAAMIASWDRFFATFVDCCHGATADRVSQALMLLSDFTNKHQHAVGPTVDRLRKLLMMAKSTGEVSTSIGSLKRARLLDTLCA